MSSASRAWRRERGGIRGRRATSSERPPCWSLYIEMKQMLRWLFGQGQKKMDVRTVDLRDDEKPNEAQRFMIERIVLKY